MLTLGGVSRRFKTHTPPPHHTHTHLITHMRPDDQEPSPRKRKAVCDEILVELEIISL